MWPVEEKVRLVVEERGSILGRKHLDHVVGLTIVDRVSAGNEKALSDKRVMWISRLKATGHDL